MKKVLATALVASLGFAGAASAMSFDDVSSAQKMLNDYGFSVDADTLSAAQVRALNTINVDTGLEGPRTAEGRVLTTIRAILR